MRISDWSSDVCSSDLVLGLGVVGRQANELGIVEAEQRARVDIDRRAQAEIVDERKLQFGPARIISKAAKRIVGQDAVLPGDDIAFRIEAAANHARSDATTVDASQLRLAKEEAVAQEPRIAARTGRILEAVDVRSEESRVGEEGVSECRSRWAQ